MRTFLSYDIEGQAVISKIGSFQNELLSTGGDLKLVRPEILHFTVRFLGEINEGEKEKIVQALEGKFPPLELEVHFEGIGTFPSESKISVIWIGSSEESSKKLESTAKEINRLLEKEIDTLPKENLERFNPHVTIARVKSGKNKPRLVEFIQAHKNEDFGSAKIGSLRLKLSELTPEGPKYQDLHVFP